MSFFSPSQRSTSVLYVYAYIIEGCILLSRIRQYGNMVVESRSQRVKERKEATRKS